MNLQVPTPIAASLASLLVLSGCQQSAGHDPAASSTESIMHITGAGSSFAAPIVNKWFETWRADLRSNGSGA